MRLRRSVEEPQVTEDFPEFLYKLSENNFESRLMLFPVMTIE